MNGKINVKVNIYKKCGINPNFGLLISFLLRVDNHGFPNIKISYLSYAV